MKFQFYYQTDTGFEKINIVSFDDKNQTCMFRFINEPEEIKWIAPISRIVQLDIIPTKIYS